MTPAGSFGNRVVWLPTAAEAAAADVVARERFGVPSRVLMESAGRAAALVLHRLHPEGHIVGLAGNGNNGGDLLVMARVLHTWGRTVTVIVAGSHPPDSALTHHTDVRMTDEAEGVAALGAADVIVDGMLGTGSNGAPHGRVAEWIQRMNATSRPIVALDIPSGVDATSGVVSDQAVRAHTTVCFGWPKLGLLLQPARQQCGRLIAVEIGFPPASLTTSASAITSGWARATLRARSPDAHKGSAGRLLVLAGSDGMAGAAALAGEAALRAGTGLLRIASWSGNREILQGLVPEATFLDRDHVDGDHTGPMNALVAGPGIGKDDAAQTALRHVLSLMQQCPTLLDADAITVLAEDPAVLVDVARTRDVVITPHAKELSRLTGNSIEGILGDMPGAARDAARTFRCTVLLKGQPSIVARPDGSIMVGTVGSSDVATAGMGDQLAGTIGGLMAGGHAGADAAALGLFLCGRAADIASRGRSLTPRDVSAHLAGAMADPGPRQSALELPFITFDQSARW